MGFSPSDPAYGPYWAIAEELGIPVGVHTGPAAPGAGVRPSMGSVGDCYDNALCESFFATLECELIDRERFATIAGARVAVFEFIEGWYNPHRRHSALNYESPMAFEHYINRRSRRKPATV